MPKSVRRAASPAKKKPASSSKPKAKKKKNLLLEALEKKKATLSQNPQGVEAGSNVIYMDHFQNHERRGNHSKFAGPRRRPG